MLESFISQKLLSVGPWQALERAVARLMKHGKFTDVRLVGQSGDKGADILANFHGKRYVVQVKFRSSGSIDLKAVDEVMNARNIYRADTPIIATNRVFNEDVSKMKDKLSSSGVYLQLWNKGKLMREIDRVDNVSDKLKEARPYQEEPIASIIESIIELDEKRGMVVMATGLGKTFVAAESIRRIRNDHTERFNKILVIAHTNPLVYQLERSFWPCLGKNDSTAIWNGIEKGDLDGAVVTFACIDSLVSIITRDGELPVQYDLVLIDEAHHAGSKSYTALINGIMAGKNNGPYLLGLTATPWRSDEADLAAIFGRQLCSIDIAQGMSAGYLSNVDYRMHVDNVTDWKMVSKANKLSPKAINRTIFIKEWDDAVIDVLSQTWLTVDNPKAIVFCQDIEHAFTMRDKINSFNFTRAEVIYSGEFNGHKMKPSDRNIALSDFTDGVISVMCAVDIFNEGIDVPDVNILVFQRVTHSRRIFVQQLGRGLRISPGKDKVIVLDFVSDIRRFAAGLELKEKLSHSPRYIELGNPIHFVNKTGEDPRAEAFLKQWLDDVAAIQDAGEEDYELKFPPDFETI